jgi:glycosyltransferase involved in cell wall biosynthesis
MKASVLLLTMNEAANLPRCLDALSWCDDVVVLDSGSTDETLAIAKARGARILERPFDDFAAQRNYGLETAGFRHDWVLHLDADEVLTGPFVSELNRLDAPPGVDAFLVPSKLMLFGRWLRRSGMYPVYQVRLGRRDVLRFKQVGHGQRETLPPERLGVFPEPYLHYSFSAGIKAWLAKHVQYASDEALALVEEREAATPAIGALLSRDKTMRRRALKALSGRVPLTLRPWLRFVHVYLFCGGFLDGGPGLTYSLLLASYEGMIATLTRELLCERSKAARRLPAEFPPAQQSCGRESK